MAFKTTWEDELLRQVLPNQFKGNPFSSPMGGEPLSPTGLAPFRGEPTSSGQGPAAYLGQQAGNFPQAMPASMPPGPISAPMGGEPGPPPRHPVSDIEDNVRALDRIMDKANYVYAKPGTDLQPTTRMPHAIDAKEIGAKPKTTTMQRLGQIMEIVMGAAIGAELGPAKVAEFYNRRDVRREEVERQRRMDEADAEKALREGRISEKELEMAQKRLEYSSPESQVQRAIQLKDYERTQENKQTTLERGKRWINITDPSHPSYEWSKDEKAIYLETGEMPKAIPAPSNEEEFIIWKGRRNNTPPEEIQKELREFGEFQQSQKGVSVSYITEAGTGRSLAVPHQGKDIGKSYGVLTPEGKPLISQRGTSGTAKTLAEKRAERAQLYMQLHPEWTEGQASEAATKDVLDIKEDKDVPISRLDENTALIRAQKAVARDLKAKGYDISWSDIAKEARFSGSDEEKFKSETEFNRLVEPAYMGELENLRATRRKFQSKSKAPTRTIAGENIGADISAAIDRDNQARERTAPPTTQPAPVPAPVPSPAMEPAHGEPATLEQEPQQQSQAVDPSMIETLLSYMPSLPMKLRIPGSKLRGMAKQALEYPTEKGDIQEEEKKSKKKLFASIHD